MGAPTNQNSQTVTQPFGLQDQQTSNNQQSVPVAYLAGTRRIAATWLSPIYNVSAQPVNNGGGKKGGGGGGKGGSSGTQTYNYYGNLGGGLCMGPVDALLAVIVSGQQVWPGGQAWASGIGVYEGQSYIYDGQTWVAQQNHITSVDNAPGNADFWTQYAFARGSGYYDDIAVNGYGTMRIYWGLPGQSVDLNWGNPSVNNGPGNNLGQQHPNYTGLCYIVLLGWLLGEGTTNAPNLEVVVRRAPNQSIIEGASAALNDGQANMAAVLAELLTDQNMLGQPAELLDADVFQAAAEALDAEKALAAGSVLLDAQDTFRSVADKVQQMTDNWVRFNAVSGLIQTGVYRHGQTPGAYPTITAVDLTERPKFTAKGWADAKSRVVVTYKDRAICYEDNSDKADDPRAFFVLGEHRSDTAERPYICRRSQAIQNAAETLRMTGKPQLTADLTVRREIGRGILPGDYALLDVDLEPNVSSVYAFFRVTQRTVPEMGPIKLTLLADNTLAPIVWQGATPPRVPIQYQVQPLTAARLLEGPYGLTGVNCGVVALAQRADRLTTGFHLHFDTDSGGTFSALLGGQSVFAVKAALSADAAEDATTLAIAVADQPDLQWLAEQPGDLAAANNELLCLLVSVIPAHAPATADDGQVAEDANGYALQEVCSVSASALQSAGHYNLTVRRGGLNTTAQAWTAANTEVWIIPRLGLVMFTHSEFETLQQNRQSGGTPAYGYFKLTPYMAFAEQELSEATSRKFRFPLKSPSAPNLTLVSPVAPNNILSLSSATFPYLMSVAGTWEDADENLVSWQILVQKSDEAAPRLIKESVFTAAPSASFAEEVGFSQGGTYNLTLRAQDSTGLSTTVVITVGIAGGGAKCVPPVVMFEKTVLGTTAYGCFGPLFVMSQTPGATFKWDWLGWDLIRGTWQSVGQGWFTFDANNPPMHVLRYTAGLGLGQCQRFRFYTVVAGMANSDLVSVVFIDAE